MYHYDPKTALEELAEDAILPHPVHARDMILRARLTEPDALEMNRLMDEYLKAFGAAQTAAKHLLSVLSQLPLKHA